MVMRQVRHVSGAMGVSDGSGAGKNSRRLGGMLRRGLYVSTVITAVVVPTSALAHAGVPAPPPARHAPTTAENLTDRYQASRVNITEAARMAKEHGSSERAERLQAMAAPTRQFLAFDGRGSGRAVEVLGNLATAQRIAVLVPGADTRLDTYDPRNGRPDKTLGGAAAELHSELNRQAPRIPAAVVAWLGYDTPNTISPEVVTSGRATSAARELRAFVDTLHRANRIAAVSLLGHSYGSVVCAQAASGLAAADIVLYGCPGAGVEHAADLRARARIWAGRGSSDWVADIPHVQANLLGTTVGFGPDPVSANFGARLFTAGDVSHSDYHKPGSLALTNLARITLGKDPLNHD
ncbi:alpha/beta hydrolase family protein [Streptomyces yunnanensis]|uniref:Alpha/beta hydrolase family protein n=1 Tax=Streptomyces yunnanensis TaxID=156453 RepID=A0ABY8AII7_9ACTN|nr:alpha/beta hydrolase [Streptomyces yunnanensis]WEB44461.1 alpha/beta hydrolase family protein [Streptomyces yunnanensis]